MKAQRFSIVGWVCLALLAGVGLAEGQSAKTAPPPSASPAPSVAKPAPVGPDPAATSATYGDWVLRCQRVGPTDKTQRLCEVAQTIQVQGQQAPIAQVALGRVATADPLKITVALPANISLPGSVTLALSDKDPAPMPLIWRRCLPGACIADAALTGEQLKALRGASHAGRLTFKDAAGRDVALPLSFRGLAQALDALAKV